MTHDLRVGALDSSQKSDPVSQVVLDIQGMEVHKVEMVAQAGGEKAKPTDHSFLQIEEEEGKGERKESKKGGKKEGKGGKG